MEYCLCSQALRLGCVTMWSEFPVRRLHPQRTLRTASELLVTALTSRLGECPVPRVWSACHKSPLHVCSVPWDISAIASSGTSSASVPSSPLRAFIPQTEFTFLTVREASPYGTHTPFRTVLGTESWLDLHFRVKLVFHISSYSSSRVLIFLFQTINSDRNGQM